MKKTIKVKIKNVYGSDLCYPLTYAKELETLTGNKTLTARNIEALKGLGFSFEQEAKII
ncbi:hypothetical protein LCGC14_2229320 [marine sediment metagenome]|uniref:Uncharacterized protein n=1 Tax=marine sediment metagenome TaxID=412755 RepID=A0A0F9D8U8_9ZZZZ